MEVCVTVHRKYERLFVGGGGTMLAASNKPPMSYSRPPQLLNSLPWLSHLPPLSLCFMYKSLIYDSAAVHCVCRGSLERPRRHSEAHTVSIHCHFFGYGHCWSGDSQSEIVASTAWFMASPVIPCLVLSVCSDLFFYCSKNLWAYLTVKELVYG